MKYFVELDHINSDIFTVGLMYLPFLLHDEEDPHIRVDNGQLYPLGGIEDKSGYVVDL